MANSITVAPVGNVIDVDLIGNQGAALVVIGNSVTTRSYNVFTTRTFLTQSQIYEEDGEVTHDTDI